MRKRWCPLAGILSPFGRKKEGGTVAVSVALTGLTSNAQYDNYAEIGSDVGLTADGGAPDTIKWGSTPGGDDYGTTATITVSGANDTGSPSSPAILYYSGTLAAVPFSGAVAIRSELAVNTVAPVITNSDPAGSDFGDTVSINNGTWTAPAVVSYNRRLLVDAVVESSGPSASFDIDASHDQAAITGDVTATTSAGMVAAVATGGFTVDDFTVPTIAAISISGTVQVGQTLSLGGGAMTGNPDPSRIVTWYADGIEFATGGTALLTASEEGAAITVEAYASNVIGNSATVSAGPTAAVAAAASVASVVITGASQAVAGGDVSVTYTSDVDTDGELILFLASATDPVSGDFNTGATSGYRDLGPLSLTAADTAIAVACPDGLFNTFQLGYLPDGGGDSDIALSPDFLLDSRVGGGALTYLVLGSSTEQGGSNSFNLDFTDVLEGDRIVITATKARGNATGGILSTTVGGVATTERRNTHDGTVRTKAYAWDMVATAGMEGNASVAIAFTTDASGFGSSFFEVYAIRGTIGSIKLMTTVKGTGPAAASVRGSLAVADGDILLMAAVNEDAAASMTMTPTAPMSTDLYALNSSANGNLLASGEVATTETLSLGYDQTDGSGSNIHYAMTALAYAA